MKGTGLLSLFGALLGSVVVVSAETSSQSALDAIINPLSSFSRIAVKTTKLTDDIDFDNAQPTADEIKENLNEMMDVLGDVLKATHEPNGRWTAPKLDKSEQQKVCAKYDQLTYNFMDLATSLHIASVGIGTNTKDVSKRVVYVAEQWFFGFDHLRHGPLEKLLPLCSKEAQANTNKILEDIKGLIRAYGGTTECSRLGGPLVNVKHTCKAGAKNLWDFPGGIITKR